MVPIPPGVRVPRPPKFKDKKLKNLTIRLPEDLRSYLENVGPTATDAAIRAILYHRDMAGLLEELNQALLLSAAHHGQAYESAQAATQARLIRLGLEVESKARPKK